MAKAKPSSTVSRSATFTLPGQHEATEKTRQLRRVGQDKSASLRDRAKLLQPASRQKSARSRKTSTLPARTKNRSNKRQTVPLTLWVHPLERAELERLANAEGLSVSLTARTLLKEAIRQKLHTQHAVLLQPIIQEAIRKEMRGQTSRLALLLVRVAFNAALTRRLVVNILGRQPKVTDELLNEIFDKAAASAKKDILRRSPSLAPVIDELERLLQEEP